MPFPLLLDQPGDMTMTLKDSQSSFVRSKSAVRMIGLLLSLWWCFWKPSAAFSSTYLTSCLSDTAAKMTETSRPLHDERGAERVVSTPAGWRKCMMCRHYCCGISGGHGAIIWKSIPEQPAGLSCFSAVGPNGLSLTTNQCRVDKLL